MSKMKIESIENKYHEEDIVEQGIALTMGTPITIIHGAHLADALTWRDASKELPTLGSHIVIWLNNDMGKPTELQFLNDLSKLWIETIQEMGGIWRIMIEGIDTP